MSLLTGLIGAWNFNGTSMPDYGMATGQDTLISYPGNASAKNNGVGFIRQTGITGMNPSIISIELDAEVITPRTNTYLMGKLTTGLDNQFAILQGYFSTEVCFYAAGFSAANSQSTEILGAIDGNPHHIVYTYDGVTVKGYLDGILKCSSVINKPMDTSPNFDLYFFTYDGSGFISDAEFNHCYLYDRVLTQDEVTQLATGIQYPFSNNSSNFFIFF